MVVEWWSGGGSDGEPPILRHRPTEWTTCPCSCCQPSGALEATTMVWSVAAPAFCPLQHHSTTGRRDRLQSQKRWLLDYNDPPSSVLSLFPRAAAATARTTMPSRDFSVGDTSSMASSTTTFMKMSNPRNTPETCRDAFSFRLRANVGWKEAQVRSVCTSAVAVWVNVGRRDGQWSPNTHIHA